MYEFLRRVQLFVDLPEADLARLWEMMEKIHLPAGEELFAEGSRGDCAFIIESGELEILKQAAGRPVLLAVRKPGEVIGELALLEDTPRLATARARTDCVLYRFHQQQFEHLLDTSPTAARVMLNIILARWRTTSAALRQSEKMAQLGTLTAGVAHELNNPAAAVQRAVGQLEADLAGYAAAQAQVARLTVHPEQVALLDTLLDQARAMAVKPALHLEPLERSDREFAVENWLDEQDVADAWELAPMLVNLGFDAAQLAGIAATLAADQLPAVVRLLSGTYAVYDLLASIGQGAARISEIVAALKSYSFLDQAPVQAVDVHEGLENTLQILQNKLAGIRVRRQYAPDLPRIEAYGSELNQVWTNLIDNAADAVQGAPDPEITIRTARREGWISVDIRDNGPGIEAEIRGRIFDPFFTTKPPGKGVGLGLDTAYRIVVDKQRGDIKVHSRPGETVFRVDLPVSFAAAAAASQPITPDSANSDEQLRRILQDSHTVAVVQFSPRPDRPAHAVPAYLQAQGYRIIPINPELENGLGEKAYPDLLTIPEPVDVVEIFRRGEEVGPIVEQAIQIGARVVWMQDGVFDEEAAERARQAGLEVAMDVCMRDTHRRLVAVDPMA